jgi:2-amino-4-hydroxy-6-hydroxymethyldihydropteridine diphosphokinase
MGKVFNDLQASPLYETAPMYVTDQPPFINGIMRGTTSMGPLQVLRELKRIEALVGRMPRERYGPREIDLDLICYGSLVYKYGDESPGSNGAKILTIPHPRLVERRFVLKPLHDLAPDLVLPGLGSVFELLVATNTQAASVLEVSDGVFPL